LYATGLKSARDPFCRHKTLQEPPYRSLNDRIAISTARIRYEMAIRQ
jgi:hypothetical protein